jgi:putative flippase GtrA
VSVDFSTLKSPPQGTGLLHLPLKALALAYRVRGFLFAGTLGFITDAGMTFQLMDLAQLSPFQARPLAMFCAIAVTFVVNRRLTFANTSQGTTREFLRYLSVNILGASVNYTLYSLVLLTLTALAGDLVPQSLAMLIGLFLGSGIAMVVNYKGFQHFAFRKAKS